MANKKWKTWYKEFIPQRMIVLVEIYDEIYDENGESIDEEVVLKELPVELKVCGRCRGLGKHVNPSIDSHGITAEEFDEDPDFRESYFSGAYDVSCYECGGEKVVPEINEEAVNRNESYKDTYDKFQELHDDDGWDAAEAKYFGY